MMDAHSRCQPPQRIEKSSLFKNCLLPESINNYHYKKYKRDEQQASGSGSISTKTGSSQGDLMEP